jgi:GntR family transcriptional regulator, arabinose operon transcriptional repressor
MLVDRNSPVHLYLQIADSIRNTITSGRFPEGSLLPTEEDLCKLYGVSRYPMRQAMSLLVREGYLNRTRGKGTFVTDPRSKSGEAEKEARRCKAVALVLPVVTGDYTIDILKGFEKAAGEYGYGAMLAISGGSEAELAAIDRVIGCGAAGVVVFPYAKTALDEQRIDRWVSGGTYVSIIDRNPGLEKVDYVGSDNRSGGYLAARHISLNGFSSVAFVSEAFYVSSVAERFEGLRDGVKQFDMTLLNDEIPGGAGGEGERYGVSWLEENMSTLKMRLPFAVFAENDHVAGRVLAVLHQHGLAVGRDVGVVGFDNLPAGEYYSPALTTVAQNGYLMGHTAAALAISKIESGSKQIVRHILPTQLISRRSCGEGRIWQGSGAKGAQAAGG